MTSCLNFIAIFNSDKVKGTIIFHQCNPDSLVKVTFNLYEMKPNSIFGNHIHEFGDTRKGCESLGGHLNLKNKEHGSIFIDIVESHTGDLINNIITDIYGNFNFSYEDSRLNMFGDVNQSILGCSIVIHENKDDYGLGKNKESKITGNSGKRIAYSIISKMNSKY